jgi:antitoxin YefM
MRRLNLEQDIKPLSEFRANTAFLVKQVKETRRPLIITQHGKSSAVLLDVKEYQSMLDKIEILQDVHLAKKQIDAGEGIEHSKAQNMLREKYSR